MLSQIVKRAVFGFCVSGLGLIACAGSSRSTSDVATASDAGSNAAATSMSAAEAAESVEPVQAPVDPRYVWDLTDVYKTVEEWNAAREKVLARIDALPRHRGTLGQSAGGLLAIVEEIYGVYKDVSRVYSYASLSRDEDQRVPDSQSRFELARAMSAKLQEATAWLQPELLSIGKKKIDRFVRAENSLKPYMYFFRNTLRLAPHTLDPAGEQLLASASLVLSSPSQIYQMLTNADIPWPTITLSDGTEALLNQAGYTRYRSHPNRVDRKAVFDAFWSAWSAYADTTGATLNTEVQSNVFQAKARNYETALEASLAPNNIPPEVYTTLIAEVNNALPTLHRYFRLRAKLLGVDDLAYYDIYPSLVELDTASFDIERSKVITLEALAPFGKDYTQRLEYAFSQRWMHGQPTAGKRSGAYMNGSIYDVHPYILLNHNDDFESLSTFAHEWGHAVHSLLASESQPYPTADYSIFTAELASTINEILLVEHMIENAKSKKEKLFYLGQALEAIRGTLFRQAMFGEFELAIHRAVEGGEPLSGTRLTEMYLELLQKYHGHDDGVMNIDPLYAAEWAYIPHFYYDFYVYQYATSISGAAWFAERFLGGDDSARIAFLDVLKAGGSDDPYAILKAAGLDLAQPEPYRAAFRRMDGIMDRIEALL